MTGQDFGFFALASEQMQLLANATARFAPRLIAIEFTDRPEPTVADFPSAITAANVAAEIRPDYLVMKRETLPIPREIKLVDGRHKFAWDQLLNPRSITFRASGLLDENTLVAGRFASVSPDPESRELFKTYSSPVRSHCRKIGAFWVSAGAAELLSNGGRLTAHPEMSRDFDLKADAV